ncbi:MAG: hypothetical protein ACK5AN_07980, partial [Planctomyces sp.]
GRIVADTGTAEVFGPAEFPRLTARQTVRLYCEPCPATAGQVTLFVFQFADAADASGSPDQQLPGKVRNIF